MIRLIDLIRLAKIDLNDFKIHCATGSNPTPLEEFLAGKFKVWQEHQNQKNFECEHILSLIHIGGNRWLFAGVWQVLRVEKGTWKPSLCYRYKTKEVTGLNHLTGRAIIHFEKKFRASYLKGQRFVNKLLICELRENRLTVGEFPGYKSICLSYKMLQTIVKDRTPSWYTALSNVAGVYVITDISDGRLYVGSAYGKQGIWQRWSTYADNKHGGNSELRKLIKEKGEGHAANFQFSLLEVCDIDCGEDKALDRESFWKNVLRTTQFGLNKTKG